LVKDIRDRTGLSQAEFAARAGTSRTRLSAYETGRTFPELDTLERIAAAADAELAIVARGTVAMKLMASRVERDEDDIRALLRICNITAVGDALGLIEGFYGGRPIEPKVQYLVAELLA
jgi:transcriptional regulator with XRE-family HTH domain